MAALWDGYDWRDTELATWANELFLAAGELPETSRQDFLARACAGSAALRERVDQLLAGSWEPPPEQLPDWLCQPGQVLRHCFILYRLGHGGAGEVYKAIQQPLHRLVAVKVLRPTAHAGRQAFVTEALSVTRLQHANIVTVYDADFQSTPPCLVMECLEGMTVRAWLRQREGSLNAPARCRMAELVLRDTTAALTAAHCQNIVHRDIKPENLLLLTDRDGVPERVKVVDFGLAQACATPGQPVAGTPGYVAPELLAGQPADARADIFSLGVTLYEILSGAHPFAGANVLETYHRTNHHEPPALTGAGRETYAPLIAKALAKDPARRYPDSATLLADLAKLADAPAPSPVTPPQPLFSEFPRALRCWLEARSYGVLLALVSCLWGLVSLALSLAAGAACLRVAWQDGSGTPLGEMLYGYAIEPNAGAWYILGGPLCVLAGFFFLQAAHTGLAHLAENGTLAAEGGPEEPAVSRVAAANRRSFRWLTPFFLALACAVVLLPELGLRQRHAFGWVQADLPTHPQGRTYEDLHRAQQVGEMPALPGRNARVTVITNQTGGYQPAPRWLWWLFLLTALMHQTLLVAFLGWIAGKILFLFALLGRALLGTSRSGLRLRPDFQDRHDYRLGLGCLDQTYYAVLAVVLLAALAFFCQAVANLGKGTYFLRQPDTALIGQLLGLVMIVSVLAFLVLAPAGVFLWLTVRAGARERARLAARRKELEKADQSLPADTLRQRLADAQKARATLERQRLLPSRQPAFRWLLVACVLFLFILPLGVAWLDATAWQSRGLLPRLNNAICRLCGNAPAASY